MTAFHLWMVGGALPGEGRWRIIRFVVGRPPQRGAPDRAPQCTLRHRSTRASRPGSGATVGWSLPFRRHRRLALRMATPNRITYVAARAPTSGRTKNAHQNVVLITVDALRADRVSTHGYSGKTAPHLDSLAASHSCSIAQSRRRRGRSRVISRFSRVSFRVGWVSVLMAMTPIPIPTGLRCVCPNATRPTISTIPWLPTTHHCRNIVALKKPRNQRRIEFLRSIGVTEAPRPMIPTRSSTRKPSSPAPKKQRRRGPGRCWRSRCRPGPRDGRC